MADDLYLTAKQRERMAQVEAMLAENRNPYARGEMKKRGSTDGARTKAENEAAADAQRLAITPRVDWQAASLEDAIDLRLAMVGDSGKLYGICAICSRFWDYDILRPVTVGTVTWMVKLTKRRNPQTQRLEDTKVMIPVARTRPALACYPKAVNDLAQEGCYGRYLSASLHLEDAHRASRWAGFWDYGKEETYA